VPETLKARANKTPEHLVRHVPEGVRFLVANVDVQKNMFVVQIHGIKPGAPFDIELVDRYDVRYSKRTNEAGERLWVKPHTYSEDWQELVEHVMQKEYPLADGSGRMMGIKITSCDSGGKAGATFKAYDFWRWLKSQGLAGRFVLTKGDHVPGQPRTRVTFPDSQRKDQKSAARGDIPILFFNSNMLKDDLDGRLDSLKPGGGMISWPDWFPESFYQELCAEVRGDKGWEHVGQYRNEAWDLLYYCIGVCISQYIRIEVLDWNNPPGWAAPWDENDMIRSAEQESSFTNGVKSRYDFASLGKELA
jgi:phage terminase large subunit GpA-like protein